MQVTTGITHQAIISLLIVKSLYDTKNQTADEIRRSVTKEGADGVLASRTLDSMIRSRSHFDRTTGSKGTMYSLKKDAARDFKSSGFLEIINDTKTIVLELKVTDDEIIERLSKVSKGGVAATLSIGMMETIKEIARGVRFANGISNVPAVTTVKAAVQSTASGGSAMRLAMVNAKRLPATTPRSPHDQFESKVQEMANEKSTPKAETTPVAIDPAHVFDPQVDTIEVAIYKVMADGAQYTVSELEVLLGDAKMFSINSISPKLSALRRDKLLVRAVERKGRTITYELIPGSKMPQQSSRGPVAPHTKKYAGRTMSTAADPTIPPDSLAPKISDVAIPKETPQIKKEEDMNTPPKKNVKVPVTLPEGSSPLKVMITICGIEYSMADLKAIVATFDTHFDVLNPKHDIPNALVAVEYKVGDMAFSLSGARRLVTDYKKTFE